MRNGIDRMMKHKAEPSLTRAATGEFRGKTKSAAAAAKAVTALREGRAARVASALSGVLPIRPDR